MRNVIVATVVAFTLGTVQLQAAPPQAPPKATPKAPHKPLPADVGAGRVAWFDITTTNVAQSMGFYGKLFNWTFTPVGGTDQAVEIVARGTAIGTLRGAEGKLSPFNGVVYVQVSDLPASCKLAKDLGGTIPPGFPFNLPGAIGAIALVLDPAGHPVGMYSRTPLPPEKPAAKSPVASEKPPAK